MKQKDIVVVYSGLVWNSIWSHSHELAILLTKQSDVLFIEQPRLDDPTHANLYEKANYPRPKNLIVAQSKKVFKKLSIFYMIYAQWFTMMTFFKYRKRIKVVMAYNVYDVIFFKLCKLWGKKIVFMYVDEYGELAPNKIVGKILDFNTWLFAKLSYSIVCTAKLLEDRAKTWHKKVYYLPNAVKLEESKANKKIEKKGFVVGFVGALGKWIDVDYFVYSAEALQKEGIQFWIVGAGERLEELRKKVETKKLKNVTLFGFVDHKDVHSYIDAFDVCVIPFFVNKITDAVSPIKLFEYWSMKKPAICTQTYELKQFEGTILFAKNHKDMAAKILKLYKDKSLREKLGNDGYNIVKERFTWDKLAEKYSEIVGLEKNTTKK